ncbi:MAG TPA: C39 family peptidase [Candidatus Binatia bacterium]|nr:C39 family peptidase [Candidatus Binatia bacterium]
MRWNTGLAAAASGAALLAATLGTFLPARAAGTAVMLSVPVVKQDLPLDCEAAALASAMQYKGVAITQDQVVAALPDDPRAAVVSGGRVIHWSDPYAAFVGNVRGSEPNFTGYGVYYPPIAAVADSYGLVAEAGSAWTLDDLTAELSAGNPVVVWVSQHLEPLNVTSYVAFDGRSVWFAVGEHAQVLSGYDPNAGTVTLMDPLAGQFDTFPASQFMTRFDTMDAEAVAVESAPPPVPIISGMSPGVGPTSGGTSVTLMGRNFASPISLTFNGQALPISDITASTVTFTTPPAPAGDATLSLTNANGTSDQTSFTYVNPSAYQALSPFRILDTRSASCVNCSGGALGPGGSRTLQIAGYADAGSGQTIPSAGVTAVVLNLTAVGPTAGTYLAVSPAGSGFPASSSVNAPPGEVIASLVMSPLGAGGAITIWNARGMTDVVADIMGYFTSAAGSAGLYHPLPAAVRVCDSRGGQGTPCAGTTGEPLQPGETRLVQVAGGNTGVQTNGDAAAVALNLTAVAPSAATYLSVYPPDPVTRTCGTPPTISNLNVAPGVIQANRVISEVDPGTGSVCVHSALGSVNFILDVNGWFGDGADGGGFLFHPLGPSRICDTRSATLDPLPDPCAGETLSAGQSLTVGAGGQGGLPASGIEALAATLTPVNGSAGTYLRATADGAPSSTSDLNAGAGQVIANLVIVPVAPDQAIDVVNAQGRVDVVLDVQGWFG